MVQWYIYMVRCREGTLYTGIATDVLRRLEEHEEGSGKGAKYLRGRGPLKLVFKKAIGSRSLALKVESKIKRLTKDRKNELIKQEEMIEQIIFKAGKNR